MAATSQQQKTTLTDETSWNLRVVLRGVATEQGKKVDRIFSVKAHFLEETGYEPPQGSLQQLFDYDNNEEPITTTAFKVVKSRWQLSEDPNDRKDGLWVWGLFKEPLYPFMLLQLETDLIPLAGTDGDAILPLQLYAQINHKRDADTGVILEGADLKVRQMETVKADVFGVAKVDVYDEVNVGTLSILPLEKNYQLEQ